MKKILILTFSLVTSTVFAAGITFTAPSPQYGCPNTTHNVTIGATNTSGLSLPAGIVVTATLTIKDNTNTNTLGTTTQTFSGGLANGATQYVTISNVAFVGPMVCNVTGDVSFTFGVYQSYPIATTYTVQSPPDLTISESPLGTLAVSTALNGYSVNYYVGANYGTVDHTTTSTTYTPTNGGSYTAKAYDPISSCLSANPSNAVVITGVSTGVNSAFASSISVYPNPASDIIFVGLDNSTTSEAELTLTDVMGLEISKVHLSKQGNSLGAELPVSQLPEGIYFLRIQSDTGVACRKITKK
jgi:hypothetical protein